MWWCVVQQDKKDTTLNPPCASVYAQTECFCTQLHSLSHSVLFLAHTDVLCLQINLSKGPHLAKQGSVKNRCSINHSSMVLSFTEPANHSLARKFNNLGCRADLATVESESCSRVQPLGLLLWFSYPLLATGLLLGLSVLWWMILGNLHDWLVAGVCSWWRTSENGAAGCVVFV